MVSCSTSITSSSGFTVCSGQFLTLTATGAQSYTWGTGQNSNTLLITPTAITVYTVTGTDAGGCISSAVKTVVVISASLTIAGGTITCPGVPHILTASGASSYTWSTGSTSNTLTVTPPSITVYSVTGTDASGCTGTAAVSVSVAPVSTLSVSGVTNVCAGTAFTVTASGAGPNTYTWVTSIGHVGVGPVFSSTPVVNITYTVMSTNMHGCRSEEAVSIVIIPGPTISVTGNINVCPGAAVTQTAHGAVSYTWSTGATGSVVSLSPTATTIYSITGEGPNGCRRTELFSIQVIPLPLLSSNNPTVCEGSVAALIATAIPSTNVNFAWYPGAISGALVNVLPPASQFYTLVANVNGCYTQTTSYVTVMPSSNANISFSFSPVCQGNASLTPVLVKDFMTGGEFSSSSFEVDHGSGTLSVSGLAPGVYPVVYLYAGSGCYKNASSVANVTVLPASPLQVKNNVSIIEGASVTLTVSGGKDYHWGPSDYLSCSSCPAPVASPPETTQYCVSSSVGSCISSTCVTVFVGCENNGDLSVPNAFTPNGDGLNDRFCLRGWNDCISGFRIVIFDRWGEKLYESEKPDFCWDGTYKGQVLEPDVFVYVISAFLKKISIGKKGNISLIR